MFSLLKKKPSTTEPTPQPQSQVFESGKELQFKDEKTGEFVYQRPLSAEHRKTIMIAMQKNTMCANQAIQLFMGFMNWFDAAGNLKKEIVTTEKSINDSVQIARDDMKLSKEWLLNPQLFILERRCPPEG